MLKRLMAQAEPGRTLQCAPALTDGLYAVWYEEGEAMTLTSHSEAEARRDHILLAHPGPPVPIDDSLQRVRPSALGTQGILSAHARRSKPEHLAVGPPNPAPGVPRSKDLSERSTVPPRSIKGN